MKDQSNFKYCPRCGSSRIRWASGLPQLWSLYDCQECGYRGPLVIEEDALARKIRERWLEERSSGAESKTK